MASEMVGGVGFRNGDRFPIWGGAHSGLVSRWLVSSIHSCFGPHVSLSSLFVCLFAQSALLHDSIHGTWRRFFMHMPEPMRKDFGRRQSTTQVRYLPGRSNDDMMFGTHMLEHGRAPICFKRFPFLQERIHPP